MYILYKFIYSMSIQYDISTIEWEFFKYFWFLTELKNKCIIMRLKHKQP